MVDSLIDILDRCEKVSLEIEGHVFQVPKGHPLLRAFQYLELKDVAINVTAGPFCWNGDCQSCLCDLRVNGVLKPQSYACQYVVESDIQVVKINENYDFCPD
ncbi:MAG: (2Fe-2S)-binding protein [Acidobacteria bacterium]|nr:(2Fe-2S)-binding protein [Acidobacteriota bacterium]